MTNFYNPKQSIKLRDLLDKAAKNGAEILIPDLQRSFVWNPDQIILLVDSIFRGWPFGSLLTWKFIPNKKDETVESSSYGIPARGFYFRYSRVPNNDYGRSYAPSSGTYFSDGYTMVLDGQQRIQSLLLAFSPEATFRLLDYDWYSSLKPEALPARRTSLYSTGMLCLNTDNYLTEIKAHNGNCDAITICSCLEWVIVNLSDCSKRRASTSYPLPILKEGRHIPLHVLWKLSAKSDDIEILARLLRDVLGRCVSNDDHFSDHDVTLLAKFTKQLNHVGLIDVPCLEIQPCHFVSDPEDTNGCDEEQKAYDDAIVSIFTRLNTAGRALTSQEITYAWLKRGWRCDRNTFSKASDLVDAIRESFSFASISDDDAISLLSTIWCVQSREDGKPLGRRDFLLGDVIRPLATYLSEGERPDTIASLAVDFALIAETTWTGSYLSSFNSIQIAFLFYMTLRMCRKQVENQCRLKTAEIDRLAEMVNNTTRKFTNRWLYISAYSGKWAKGTTEYIEVLSRILAKSIHDVNNVNSEESIQTFANKLSTEILKTAVDSARNQLEQTVRNPGAVSQYRTRLAAWQRLTPERAKFRDLTFGEKGGESLQVDHIIPHQGWIEFVDEQFLTGKLSKEEALDLFEDGLTLDKETLLKPNMADEAFVQAKRAAKEFINHIGNCSLLKWRYNTSKSRIDYYDFMNNVYEAKQDPAFLKKWSESMFLSEPFLHPFTKESGYKSSSFSIQEFVDAIRNRERIIFSELKKFVSGEAGFDELY